MIPLAVSGRIVIGVAVVAALLLVWVLLRLDTRDEAAEKAEEEQAARGPTETSRQADGDE
jgi:hypothetical protein